MLNTRYYVSERYYVAFLLGYDLLHDAFDKCDSPEGDTTFDRCLRIADSFLNSEYNTTLLGLYECVENYLRYSREFKIFEERFSIYYKTSNK